MNFLEFLILKRPFRLLKIQHRMVFLNENQTQPIISLITSPAIIRPTTEGTKAVLPGTCLRFAHVRAAPGGQIQFDLQLFEQSSKGWIGFSLE
jgi:hypothetical protein